ncbi:unnamed protein product [Menidia menidia]|uniref:(Atlantic silverside) hypothetical protein n=1 Tax=Menidia menidia TaxID=238744 RepID=A0A8S4C066_9TELE|nr:unnamed protein product [Menidia menidia]
MEPDLMPLHSSTPPQLDCDGDEGVGSEEEEFGDFSVGISCSSLGFAVAPDPASRFQQPPPVIKPETHQPNSTVYQPAEESPHSSSGSESSRGPGDVESQNSNAESLSHLTNGFGPAACKSGGAPVLDSPEEETGFADFTVFTEQVSHPWCCGLTEQWDTKVGGVDGSSGRDVKAVTESEPRSQIPHCVQGDAALVHPPQDHHQPQPAAAALSFSSGGDDSGSPLDARRERRLSWNSPETSETQRSTERLPQGSMYGSASDDLGSFCDDWSFEGVSADLEPIVSSLGSEEGQTECDRTDEEEEEEEEEDSMANLGLSGTGKDFQPFNLYVTQETSATSSRPQPGPDPKERLDLADVGLMHQRDRESAQTAEAGAPFQGNLRLSDSFADFCSAPTRDDEGLWADFKEQLDCRELVSNFEDDGGDEEGLERREQLGALRNSCQLFHCSFPDVLVPAVEGPEELLVLSAPTLHLLESQEVMPKLSCALKFQQEMLSPRQGIHNSLGLQFRWGGSHSNRNLLRCLGVDEGNIVSLKLKQPPSLPAHASPVGPPSEDCF